jgi:hypothetical protein
MRHLHEHGARCAFVLAALLLQSGATAQGQATLPGGYLGISATSSSSFPFSSSAIRYQEIHTTQRSVPMTGIYAMSFRRDESQSAFGSAGPRTAIVELRMGHGAIDRFGSRFDDNYSAPPTVVFTPKLVNLPDWTQPTGAGGTFPEPWSLRLPFDVPFDYDGVQDLVWELHYTFPSSTGTFRADRTATSANPLYTSDNGTDIGTGCLVPGRSQPFDLSATLYSHYNAQLSRLRVSTRNGPGTTPIFLNIGFSNLGATVPFLCTPVISSGEIIVPLGASSSSGSTASAYYTYPFAPSTLSLPLFAQAFGVNTSQVGNVSITQGVELNGPQPPSQLPDYAYLVADDPAFVQGEGPFHTGSVVTRLEW